jgi:hypothetical protein
MLGKNAGRICFVASILLISIFILGCCGLTEKGGGWQDVDNNGVMDLYSSGTNFTIVADESKPNASLIYLQDTNDDGKIDFVAMDTDENGRNDTFLYDTDGDGKTDLWQVILVRGGKNVTTTAWDLNKDGIPEVYDSNGDGKVDAWDVNSDGVIDQRDVNGDGIPDLHDDNFDGVFDELK